MLATTTSIQSQITRSTHIANNSIQFMDSSPTSTSPHGKMHSTSFLILLHNYSSISQSIKQSSTFQIQASLPELALFWVLDSNSASKLHSPQMICKNQLTNSVGTSESKPGFVKTQKSIGMQITINKIFLPPILTTIPPNLTIQKQGTT